MKKQVISVVTIVLLLFCISTFSSPQKEKMDSLLNEVKTRYFSDSASFFQIGELSMVLFEKEKMPHLQAKLLQFYGDFFHYNNSIPKARTYYIKALELAKKHKNDTLCCNIEIRFGFLELDEENFTKSLHIFSESIKKAESIHDTTSLIEAYNGLALYYEKKINREKATENYIKALKLAEKANKPYHVMYVTLNLGLIKFQTNQPEQALSDFRRVFDLAIKIKNDRFTGVSSRSIAMTYHRLGNADSTKHYYDKALSHLQKSKDYKFTALTYSNVAYFNLVQKKYNEARVYADSAFKIVEKYDFVELKTLVWTCRADIELDRKQYSKALVFADSALLTINSEIITEELAACYGLYSDIYEAMGHYDKALENYKRFNSISDSLSDIAGRKMMNELQIQYEVTKKEKRLLEEQRKVAELKRQAIIKQKNIGFLLLSIFGLVSIISILSYVYYIRLSKKRQEQFSRNLIEQIERERGRIAKELHDSVGGSLSMIKNKVIVNKNPSTLQQELTKDLNDVIDHTRTISHQLYPSYLQKIGLKQLLHEFLRKIEKDNTLVCISNIEETNTRLTLDQKNHVFRIVQECVNNTMKHAQATTIILHIYIKNSFVNLIYHDDGIGLKKSTIGMGFMSIEERVKILNGTLQIKNNQKRGIKITIRFPSQLL